MEIIAIFYYGGKMTKLYKKNSIFFCENHVKLDVFSHKSLQFSQKIILYMLNMHTTNEFQLPPFTAS